MAAHVFSGGGLVMFGFKFPASGSLPVILSSLAATDVQLKLTRCMAHCITTRNKLVAGRNLKACLLGIMLC